MTQPDVTGYGWKAWRIKRLLEILQHKAMGLTDQQVAEKMPISQKTVSRELNSPQAADIGRKLRKRAESMIWPLIERQLKQIEGDTTIKPAQKLFYRGLLIGILTRLVPKQIEQKLEASGDLNFILRAWRPNSDENKDEEDGRDND
jgi:hypothetical protein